MVKSLSRISAKCKIIFPGQQYSCTQRREGSHADQTEGADDRVADLRSHILIVENMRHRHPLGHEYHQKGNIPAGIGHHCAVECEEPPLWGSVEMLCKLADMYCGSADFLLCRNEQVDSIPRTDVILPPETLRTLNGNPVLDESCGWATPPPPSQNPTRYRFNLHFFRSD